MVVIINQIIEKINAFLKNEYKKDKRLGLLWKLGVIISIVILALFALFKVSFWGFLLLIISIILIFIYRFKILSFTLNIQWFILIVIMVFWVILIFYFRDNVEPLPTIEYKQADITIDKGSYNVEINTDDSSYVLTLIFTLDKSIIPADFIWNGNGAEQYKEQGVDITNDDHLEAFIVSKDDTVEPYSNGSLAIITNYNGTTMNLVEISPTKFIFNFKNKKALSDWLNKYNKIEVYRYRVKEVGIRDLEVTKEGNQTSYNYGYNSEKAYKLHPVVIEFELDYTDLKQKTGL